MSTILNTLKKLEEEKSVLEKNIDLRELLLQGQEGVYSPAGQATPGKWGRLLGLILAGGLLGALAVYFIYPAKQRPVPEAGKTRPPAAANQNVETANSPAAKLESIFGIPLSHIPDDRSAPSGFLREPDYYEPEDIPLEPLAPVLPAPVKAGPRAELPPEIEAIDSLIKIATASGPADSKEAAVAASAIPDGRIPGLKVKGIIFLGADNPSNHVLVSTPGEANRKLKAGETILNASLQSVEAKKAVFTYQGRRLKVGIGE